MWTLEWKSRGRRVTEGRHPLAPYLGLVIGLQACLCLGMQLSPVVSAAWSPPAPSPTQQVAQWRQTRYNPGRDPKVGNTAPPLRLFTLARQPLELEDLRGGCVALIFADDESG